MKCLCICLIAGLLLGIAACTKTHQRVGGGGLHTPVQLQVGAPGSPMGPISLQTGQLVLLPQCCPPIELRDAKGKFLQKLKVSSDPQPMIARAGSYSIVGHDPAGEECVLRVAVTNR